MGPATIPRAPDGSQSVSQITPLGAGRDYVAKCTNPPKETIKMELADGAWIFLAFIIIALGGVVLGYFTTSGGINTRPYGKIYSGGPGARGRGEVSGRHPPLHMNKSSRRTR
jgi:hypothetical protein